MPVGIAQSALDPEDLERSFRIAAEAEAEGIELLCRDPKDIDWLLGETGGKSLARLKKDTGLNVPSIALEALTRDESLLGPPAVAERAKTLIRAGMEAAAAVGADVVLLPFLGKAAIELDEELDRVSDALMDLAEEAEEVGITLGIESTLNVNRQLHLLEHVATYESVKVCYDTGDILARKWDPATYLRELGRGHLCQVRFRDVRLGMEGTPPQWDVALGAGDVDFPAVANAISALGYEGWVMVAGPTTEDPPTAAKRNVDFARNVLKQARG